MNFTYPYVVWSKCNIRRLQNVSSNECIVYSNVKYYNLYLSVLHSPYVFRSHWTIFREHISEPC
jgi:hypothetical protein